MLVGKFSTFHNIQTMQKRPYRVPPDWKQWHKKKGLRFIVTTPTTGFFAATEFKDHCNCH
jgi:hypothetical protein